MRAGCKPWLKIAANLRPGAHGCNATYQCTASVPAEAKHGRSVRARGKTLRRHCICRAFLPFSLVCFLRTERASILGMQFQPAVIRPLAVVSFEAETAAHAGTCVGSHSASSHVGQRNDPARAGPGGNDVSRLTDSDVPGRFPLILSPDASKRATAYVSYVQVLGTYQRAALISMRAQLLDTTAAAPRTHQHHGPRAGLPPVLSLFIALAAASGRFAVLCAELRRVTLPTECLRCPYEVLTTSAGPCTKSTHQISLDTFFFELYAACACKKYCAECYPMAKHLST